MNDLLYYIRLERESREDLCTHQERIGWFLKIEDATAENLCLPALTLFTGETKEIRPVGFLVTCESTQKLVIQAQGLARHLRSS